MTDNQTSNKNKKHRKKKMPVMLIFGMAFSVTLLIGTLVLCGLSYLQDQKSDETMARLAGAEDVTVQNNGEAADELPSGEMQMAADSADGFVEDSREVESAQEALDGAEKELSDLERVETEGESDLLGEDETPEETTEETQAEKGAATLVFTGDICFFDEYSLMSTYRQRGSDITKCISETLLSEMRSADICMVNNEFSYSNRGTPLADKMYTFRSKPENVSILNDMGVDIASVANNHAYDYGPDAFEDTLDIIRDAGVICVGGGRNIEEASKPAQVSVNGNKIAILAATQIERNGNPDTRGATENSPGVMRCFAPAELDCLLERIAEAKIENDFVIVFIHWGTENTTELDWSQPGVADAITKAGADLIVGGHPHCLQGLDIVNGVPVVYSLGNYWFNSKTVDTALLKIIVKDGELEMLQMIPALQANCSTTDLQGAEAQRVINSLQSLSPNMHFEETGKVTW